MEIVNKRGRNLLLQKHLFDMFLPVSYILFIIILLFTQLLIGLLVVQFGGSSARNRILKCEITRPITPLIISKSWIVPVA